MTVSHCLNNHYTDFELNTAMLIFKEALQKCTYEHISPFALTHAIAIVERSNEMSAKAKIGDTNYQAFWDMCQEDAVKLYRRL